MLQIEPSKIRQTRLLDLLADRRLDAIAVGLRHHAYYFSAHLPFWQHEGAFILFADGQSRLVAANCEPGLAATNEILPFEAHYRYTLRQEQPQVVAEIVREALTDQGAKRIGVDSSAVTSQIQSQGGFDCESIDENLWRMRRPKDPDELALMEKAIDLTKAMHARAREIVRPGVCELEVYGELHSAAVKAAGEPLSAWLGNDYQCGTMGGPPRANRPAEEGELYILDLGPAYRGYFADNCRAYSVNGKPSAAQTAAWEAILPVFDIIERMAKPGAKCREIHDEVADYLKTKTGMDMPHHLGHGVGLQPHEFPHLNPNWDDTLVKGEVFTVEPGLYSEKLACGMRIENQYVVTSKGVRNLVDIPLEL